MKWKPDNWDSSGDIFSFRVKQDQLKEQVSGYGSIGFKAWRKQFAAGLAFLTILSFTLGGIVNTETILILVGLLILALFSSRGKKWAIVLASAVFSTGFILNIISLFKQGNLSSGFFFFSIIIFFGLLDTAWKALRVEFARKKVMSLQ